jgi:hypothetical protein
VNASDIGYTATDFNHHRGHQRVAEGTDATVALATSDQDRPTGECHDRTSPITYGDWPPQLRGAQRWLWAAGWLRWCSRLGTTLVS